MARLFVPAGGLSQERSGLTFWPPAPLYTALIGMGFPSWTTWLLTFKDAGFDMATPPDVSHYASPRHDARPLSVTSRGSRPGWPPAVRRVRRGGGPGEPGPARPPDLAPWLGPQAQEEALALRAVHDARGGRGHGHRRAGLCRERLLLRGGSPRETAAHRHHAARPPGAAEHGVRRDVAWARGELPGARSAVSLRPGARLGSLPALGGDLGPAA